MLNLRTDLEHSILVLTVGYNKIISLLFLYTDYGL
jgi:hypothetical protein